MFLSFYKKIASVTLIALTCLNFCSFAVYSSNDKSEPDTAMPTYLNQLVLLADHDSISTQELYKKINIYFDETEEPDKKAKLLYKVSSAFYDNAHYTISIHFGNKLKKYAKETDDPESEAAALQLIGKNYREITDFRKSIDCYMKALNLYDSLQLMIEKGRCLKDIGLVYYDVNETNKAEKYYKEALEISTKVNDRQNIAYLYNNLGMVTFRYKKHDESMRLFKKALKIKKELDKKGSLANTINNIGYLYRALGETDSSISYYQKAIPIYKEINDESGLANSYNNLALSLIQKEQYKEAQHYLDLSLEISERLQLLNKIKENYLHQFHKNQREGNYKKALENYIDYSIMKDSISSKEFDARLSKLEARYEIEKQQKEIEFLKKDKQLRNKRQRLVATILIISGIIVAFFFVMIIRSNTIKKKKGKQLEEQNREIKEKNEELKTAHDQLQNRKEEIEQQRNEITKQRNQLEEQFKIIQAKNWSITNSFIYASHIQAALLPPREELKNYFNDYFILLRPKDIVSGDFYWYTKTQDRIIVAAADCTGHGVAGGLMSMLGVSFLNEIVNVQNIISPDIILSELRKMIINALNQKTEDNSYLSGIDISVVSIKDDYSLLEFAGANNSIYIIRNNELKEYTGDKMPISLYENMSPFNKISITPFKEDQVYMFTDGYTDQFGGEKEKKFKIKPFRKLIVESNNRTMDQQKTVLNKTFENWKGDLEQVDDVLVLGLKL